MSQASTGTPETLAYITIQDLLWLNQQVTKKVNAFNYAVLEEAAFYQYGYGQSKDLLRQASQFVTAFAKKQPFAGGNVATAFAGFVTFVLINGCTLDLSDSDGTAWLDKIAGSQAAAESSLREIAKPEGPAHRDIEECAHEALRLYPMTLAELAKRD
jgi:prophage maintenance system killer protein